MFRSSPLNDPLLTCVPVHAGYKVLGGVALTIVMSICACSKKEGPEPEGTASELPVPAKPMLKQDPAPAKPEAAEPPSGEAIELKPGDAYAYYNQGIAKDNTGDYKGAIADFTKYIELKPDGADAYYNRGNAKDNSGDYIGAIADFNKYI